MRLGYFLGDVEAQSEALLVRLDIAALKGREEVQHGLGRNGRSAVAHADRKALVGAFRNDADRFTGSAGLGVAEAEFAASGPERRKDLLPSLAFFPANLARGASGGALARHDPVERAGEAVRAVDQRSLTG